MWTTKLKNLKFFVSGQFFLLHFLLFRNGSRWKGGKIRTAAKHQNKRSPAAPRYYHNHRDSQRHTFHATLSSFVRFKYLCKMEIAALRSQWQGRIKNETPSYAQERLATARKETQGMMSRFFTIVCEQYRDTNPLTWHSLTKNVAIFLEASKKD